MPIIYHAATQTFHLSNQQVSYIFKVLENGQLGQLYFGKQVGDRESFDHLLDIQARSLAPAPYRGNLKFSLEVIKQEYPAYGTGDFRDPAYQITSPLGDRISNFCYQEHHISQGKGRLEALPATFGGSQQVSSLEVVLHDAVLNATLHLYYHLFEELAVITRSVKIVNHAPQALKVNRLLSMALDLYDADYELLQLDGAWSRERHLHKRALGYGIQAISSARGASSAMHNPFMALKRPQTTEHTGEVYGFSLIYSGNFLAQAQVDNYDVTRVLLGINPFEFGWQLEQNGSLQSPEAVLVYSQAGLSDMSYNFHQLFQHHLMSPNFAIKPRPILINNWEATYFNFDHERILGIAKRAKELGIELVVLDDGWFGQRNDDTTSLGDWQVNTVKLPQGIAGLSKEIKALGLQFGLWFEPEMINEVSRLYQEHPQWVISVPNRGKTYSRNQWVLDFSRQEVVDAVYAQMVGIIEEAQLDYIKWDMNRNITEAFSSVLPAQRQGEFFHRYILGVYQLYARLNERFPALLIESCASGGGRFDAGMLYYAPQAWTSDNMDPVERLRMQHGTSMIYPLISMGSHVPTSPNHQIDRHTSLKMRGDVAFFGTFGYELDLAALNQAELALVAQQIGFFKQWREVIQLGRFYRLNEVPSNFYQWMVVSADQKRVIVGQYKILASPNPSLKKFLLRGLEPSYRYYCKERNMSYLGDELMHIGLLQEAEFTGMSGRDKGDFTSFIYTFEVLE